jgi:hypothetical protein
MMMMMMMMIMMMMMMMLMHFVSGRGGGGAETGGGAAGGAAAGEGRRSGEGGLARGVPAGAAAPFPLRPGWRAVPSEPLRRRAQRTAHTAPQWHRLSSSGLTFLRAPARASASSWRRGWMTRGAYVLVLIGRGATRCVRAFGEGG